MTYQPKTTIKKGSVVGGFGAVGVAVEALVESAFPGLFPSGTVTAVTTAALTSAVNWFKNRKRR